MICVSKLATSAVTSIRAGPRALLEAVRPSELVPPLFAPVEAGLGPRHAGKQKTARRERMGRLCLVSFKSFLIGASSGSGDGPVELIARSVSVRTTLIPEAKRANEQAVF